MPTAKRLTVGILAMVAEEEGRAISARTKAALQAAKARGTKLGGYRAGSVGFSEEHHAASRNARKRAAEARARDLLPVLDQLRRDGVTSLRGLAMELTGKGIPTWRGKPA